MPLNIHSMPDTPSAVTSVPARGWVDGVRAGIEGVAHSGWLVYGIAGILDVLLVLLSLARAKRSKVEDEGGKAALTRTDRAVTRITGILATAVVATGAWKVFGLPALHLAPWIRVILFFFAEAQILAAWRRVRRH